MAYGQTIVQRHLSFSIIAGEVFVIMGGSGCGKSTLLRHLVGLQVPKSGRVIFAGMSLWDISPGDSSPPVLWLCASRHRGSG